MVSSTCLCTLMTTYLLCLLICTHPKSASQRKLCWSQNHLPLPQSDQYQPHKTKADHASDVFCFDCSSLWYSGNHLYYTLSNFENRHDVTHGRLHSSPRVTLKHACFAGIKYDTHAFSCNSLLVCNDITSNLEIGQSVVIITLSISLNSTSNTWKSQPTSSASCSESAACGRGGSGLRWMSSTCLCTLTACWKSELRKSSWRKLTLVWSPAPPNLACTCSNEENNSSRPASREEKKSEIDFNENVLIHHNDFLSFLKTVKCIVWTSWNFKYKI